MATKAKDSKWAKLQKKLDKPLVQVETGKPTFKDNLIAVLAFFLGLPLGILLAVYTKLPFLTGIFWVAYGIYILIVKKGWYPGVFDDSNVFSDVAEGKFFVSKSSGIAALFFILMGIFLSVIAYSFVGPAI